MIHSQDRAEQDQLTLHPSLLGRDRKQIGVDLKMSKASQNLFAFLLQVLITILQTCLYYVHELVSLPPILPVRISALKIRPIYQVEIWSLVCTWDFLVLTLIPVELLVLQIPNLIVY